MKNWQFLMLEDKMPMDRLEPVLTVGIMAPPYAVNGPGNRRHGRSEEKVEYVA